MDSSVAGMIRIFHSMDDRQRQEFIREVNSYIEGNQTTKSAVFSESQRTSYKVVMGPLGSVCQYCGK